MNHNIKRLSIDELKKMLHHENFKFNQGIDKGMSFNCLKEIRQNIRTLRAEIDLRTVAFSDN